MVVIGAIAGSGRSWPRLMAAGCVAAFYALPIPYWGGGLLNVRDMPSVLMQLVRSGYGVAAVLLVALAGSMAMSDADNARPLKPHSRKPSDDSSCSRAPAWLSRVLGRPAGPEACQNVQ